MSLATEISRLQTNRDNAYEAVSDKGGTVPPDANYDNLPAAIRSISGGGGGVIEELNASANGTYTPSAGVDGFAPVTVTFGYYEGGVS